MDFEAKSPDEIISQFKQKFKAKMPKPFSGPAVIVAIFLLFAVVGNTFYTVQPDQVGIVLRFGQFNRTTQPGLRFKIPLVEEATLVSTRYVYKEEFGFRTLRPGVRTHYSLRPHHDESLMLTGDLNVIDLQWVVQYRIKDPYQFLYNIRQPKRTLRDVSEAVIRQIAGDYTFTEVLTLRRVEINQKAEQELQEILDSYGTGIEIVTVMLQDVNPPDPVKPAFNEVNEAKQHRETLINQAWQQYNQKIPEARGDARRIIQEAEGYALGVVNEASGDAARFSLLRQEYTKAKKVTRRRIYLDYLSQILPKAGKKYILDSGQKGILPLLRLADETK